MGLARIDSSCRSRKLSTYTKHRMASAIQARRVGGCIGTAANDRETLTTPMPRSGWASESISEANADGARPQNAVAAGDEVLRMNIGDCVTVGDVLHIGA